MNDLAWVIFWAAWLLLVDLFALINLRISCRRLQKSIPRASLATSTQWKDRFLPMSGFLALASIVNVFLIPFEFHLNQETLDQTCAERYLPTECKSATKSWNNFCIWLILPGILAIVISILWIILAHRQLATHAQNNNTSSSQLLYHPGPLLFANGFLVLCCICCTLSGGPDLLYKNLEFKTWFRVTKTLTVVAIVTYIAGGVLTFYGSVRFVMEFRMHRGYARPRAQQNRGRSRRARREWIPMV